MERLKKLYQPSFDDKISVLEREIEVRRRMIKGSTNVRFFKDLAAIEEIIEDLYRLKDLEE